jgi:hypothetical protein
MARRTPRALLLAIALGACRPESLPVLVAVSPEDGTTIGSTTEVVLRFGEEMYAEGTVFTGALADQGVATWSRTVADDDTVTFTPATAWVDGPLPLVIDARSSAGGLSTTQVAYTVDATVASVSASPYGGSRIRPDTVVQVAFSRPVAQGSLALSGSLATGADAVWSDATHLALEPLSAWPEGEGTLALSVTDALGNPPATLQLTYEVDGTAPTLTGAPASLAMADTQALVFRFSEPMAPGSLALSGDLASSGVPAWATTAAPNDSLTLTPAVAWPHGSRTLGLDVTDVAGNPLSTVHLAFTIDGGPPTVVLAPLSGTALPPRDPVLIQFSETLDTTSLSITGSLAPQVAAVTWSHTGAVNDTVSLIPPAGGWTSGGTLTVTVADLLGNASAPLVLEFTAGALDGWLVVPFQAVKVSNDDGTRATRITPDEVALWVDEANRVFAPARIFLDYDPATDFAEVHSTLVNGLYGVEDPQWAARRDAADAIAATYPGRITGIFRWGPGASPTGGGFSWTDYDFVALPGFGDTWVCGHQNITLFAHEVGHHLGLFHTFHTSFSTVAAAQTWFVAQGRDPDVFDGDGIADTPPDPNIAAEQCTTTEGVTLDGVPFAIARHDIMSYTDSPTKAVSPGQARILRQVALLRIGGDLRDLVGASVLVEGEGLSATTTGGGTGPQTNMTVFHGKWSGDAQLWWGGAQGAVLSTTFDAGAAGLYRVYGSFTAAPDFGVHQIRINQHAAGGVVDLYARHVMPTGAVDLGVYWLGASGNALQVEAVGRAPESTGYGFGLDYLLLVEVD